MSKLATEMLNRVKAVDDPDHEPTVKLDRDTLRLVTKWKLENLRMTVAWLCRVADEALTEVQRSESGPKFE